MAYFFWAPHISTSVIEGKEGTPEVWYDTTQVVLPGTTSNCDWNCQVFAVSVMISLQKQQRWGFSGATTKRPRSALSVLNPTEAGWRPKNHLNQWKRMKKYGNRTCPKSLKSRAFESFEHCGARVMFSRLGQMKRMPPCKITHSNSSDIPSRRLPGKDATRTLFVFPVARALAVHG